MYISLYVCVSVCVCVISNIASSFCYFPAMPPHLRFHYFSNDATDMPPSCSSYRLGGLHRGTWFHIALSYICITIWSPKDIKERSLSISHWPPLMPSFTFKRGALGNNKNWGAYTTTNNLKKSIEGFLKNHRKTFCIFLPAC